MACRLRYNAIPGDVLSEFLLWCTYIAQHDKGTYARPLAHEARAVVADVHARMTDFCTSPALHLAYHHQDTRAIAHAAHSIASRLEPYVCP